MKSFASHEKSKFWSKRHTISPRQIFKATNAAYQFDCDCGHSFFTNINCITCHNSWCSYCCNPPKELCNNLNCVKCYKNSFASHEKAKYWSKNNNIMPRFVFKSCNKKYKFICSYCNNEYETNLCNIVQVFMSNKKDRK